MNNIVNSWALGIALLALTGCGRATSQTDAAAELSAPSATAVTFGQPAPAANAGVCAGAIDALASCAVAKSCDQDISMFLPATNRSQLIALERAPDYSEEGFNRYCVDVCKARDPRVDGTVFAQEVCGVQPNDAVTGEPAGKPASGSATATGPVARAFLLRGTLEVGTTGVPLAEVLAAFGQPREKSPTPHECGSAFTEGDIAQYAYADFTLETDGKTATVRSMKLVNGNRLVLATGQSVERLSEADFKRAYGSRAELFGDAYRTGISPGGDLESAYDFHFADGQLEDVDYWIGC